MAISRKNDTRTIYSSMLSLSLQMGIPYEPLELTTLNELYNINLPAVNYNYKIGHFIVGLYDIDVLDNINLSINDVECQPYDANVVIKIPIFMKDSSLSLTNADRQTYKLFTTEEYGGITYNVAYAKRLTNFTGNEPYLVTYNGSFELAPLSGEGIDFLHPITVKEQSTYNTTLEYVAFSVSSRAELTADEINNINSYIDIIYPTRSGVNKYRISQIALIQSQHESINSTSEIRNAQTAYFAYTTLEESQLNNLSVNIELGEKSPTHKVVI